MNMEKVEGTNLIRGLLACFPPPPEMHVLTSSNPGNEVAVIVNDMHVGKVTLDMCCNLCYCLATKT